MSAGAAFADVAIALLLVAGGAFAVVAAIGLVRLRNFFIRMHPPAIANTLAVWCTALAAIVYFLVHEGRLALYVWLIPILLSITAPITTAFLSRAGLFRERQRGGDVPPPPGRGST
ncbi:MAG: monovalent cation/H(+) antiporter subunit G [Burkholderiales bacterium]|nr:monovalent cation/H(+) antiporter subunit G [Burkholderiales bacterium]